MKVVTKMVHFNKLCLKSWSDLRETNTFLVLQSIILLLGAGSCKYQVHAEKKLGHQSEIKSQSPSREEYKDYRLYGECYYLVDEYKLG